MYKFEGKKVIVTGVSGQDGSYMAEWLIENTEVEVYGITRRSATPNLSNLNGIVNHPRFHLVMGDLSDSQSIDSLVREIRPDYFINFAAQSFVGCSWALPTQTFDVDAVGVIRCLEAIRKHVPDCRFYNAGSSEEFGDVEFSPQNESHPLRARSPYGAAKIAARQIVKVWRESYGLYAIQGILFNHESPRRGEEFVTRKIAKGVARIADAVKRGVEFEPLVLGNLDAQRDWSHAKDFVRGVWLMLNQDIYHRDSGRLGMTRLSTSELSKLIQEVILASDETHSVREFVVLAFAAAGLTLTDENTARVEPCAGRGAGHQINYSLSSTGDVAVTVSREFYRPAEVDLLHGDSSQARSLLGWEPEVSFRELVDEMVRAELAKKA